MLKCPNRKSNHQRIFFFSFLLFQVSDTEIVAVYFEKLPDLVHDSKMRLKMRSFGQGRGKNTGETKGPMSPRSCVPRVLGFYVPKDLCFPS